MSGFLPAKYDDLISQIEAEDGVYLKFPTSMDLVLPETDKYLSNDW